MIRNFVKSSYSSLFRYNFLFGITMIVTNSVYYETINNFVSVKMLFFIKVLIKKKVIEYAKKRNLNIDIIFISAKIGEDISEIAEWILKNVKEWIK